MDTLDICRNEMSKMVRENKAKRGLFVYYLDGTTLIFLKRNIDSKKIQKLLNEGFFDLEENGGNE